MVKLAIDRTTDQPSQRPVQSRSRSNVGTGDEGSPARFQAPGRADRNQSGAGVLFREPSLLCLGPTDDHILAKIRHGT